MKHVSAVSYTWSFDHGPREAAVRIRCDERFLLIPITQARKLSDQLHDICDEHEAKQ